LLTSASGPGIAFYSYTGAVGSETYTEAMRIDSSNRLGIGTTSPGTLLELKQLTGDTELRLYSNTGYVSRIGAVGSDNLAFSTGFTERVRIDSSGRLLVGTSSARANMFNATLSSAFQVEGTTHNTSSVSIVRNSNDTSTAAFVLGKSRGTAAGSSTLVNNDDTIAYLSFQGADGSQLVECASIACEVDGTPGANDMPGRLVFSVTSDGSASPTERARIRNAGNFNAFAPNDTFMAWSSNSAGTTFTNFLGVAGATGIANGSGTVNFVVYNNGNVQNTNNSYGAYSDAKLKENIVDASSQWDDLKALQVRKYNFKAETGQQTHTQIGLVAQEAELVSPGLVTESPDRDAEGNDLGTTTKSVNYSVLYMKAVKALQEAIAKIETLEGMVAVNNITIDEQQHQLSTLAARLTALESA